MKVTPETMEICAEVFAYVAHASVDQKRKYTGEPYINHPAAVVAILKTINPTPEMIAAAWLHDVVEDTTITLEHIEEVFGPKVREYVYYLSNPGLEAGNRTIRKANDRDRLAGAPPEVQTIKLADLIDNSYSIEQHDPSFAVLYMKEKEALLQVLHAGHSVLYKQATRIVEDYMRRKASVDQSAGNGDYSV